MTNLKIFFMLGSLLEEVTFLAAYPMDPTYDTPTVEVFSPDGGCQHSLESFPVSRADFFLYLFGQQILACGGAGTQCYAYTPANDSWSTFINGNTYCKPYGVYNGKIYFSSTSGSYDVLDPSTKQIAPWPAPPNDTTYSCQVTWQNSFIRFGGNSDATSRVITVFNFKSKSWSFVQPLQPAPMMFRDSACALIPDVTGKVFVKSTSSNQIVINLQNE